MTCLEQTTIAHFWLNEAPQLSQTSLILSLLSKIPNSEFLKSQNIRMQLCEVLCDGRWPGAAWKVLSFKFQNVAAA